MKNKYYIIATMLITANCFAFSQYATVKGRIIDYKGNQIMSVMGFNVDSVDVSSDGFFEYKVEAIAPLSEGKIVILPSSIISFRISEGEIVSLTISTDKNGNYVTTFGGSNAKLNNCLGALDAGVSFIYSSQEDAVSKSFSYYEKEVDNIFDNIKHLIDEVPSDSIRNQLRVQSDLIRNFTKFTYVWKNKRFNNAPLDSDPGFLTFIESLDVNNRKVINEPPAMINHTILLDMYLRWESERDESLPESLNNSIRLFDIIKKYVTDQDVVNSISQWKFKLYLDNGGDEYMNETLAAFEKVNNNPDAIKEIKNLTNQLKTIDSGWEAPDFVLIDADENKRMLSDLRGKVLYIDIWATWCGPCLQELPLLAGLWEKYKDNPNIEFVCISVDDSVAVWKKKLEKDKSLWKNYIVEGGFTKGPMRKLYFITGIPRFMLIDKDGRIISVNAPRPSDPTIETVLNSYL